MVEILLESLAKAKPGAVIRNHKVGSLDDEMPIGRFNL